MSITKKSLRKNGERKHVESIELSRSLDWLWAVFWDTFRHHKNKRNLTEHQSEGCLQTFRTCCRCVGVAPPTNAHQNIIHGRSWWSGLRTLARVPKLLHLTPWTWTGEFLGTVLLSASYPYALLGCSINCRTHKIDNERKLYQCDNPGPCLPDGFTTYTRKRTGTHSAFHCQARKQNRNNEQ